MEMSKPTDGIISRYINRRISIPISKFIVSRVGNISPNKVTLWTTLFGVVAALIYLFDQPIIAGIAVQIASIIDGIDGEIARMLNKQTKFGALLDSLMDRIVDTMILICFSIFAWRQLHSIVNPEIFILVTTMSISGSLLVSYFRARCEATLNIDPRAIGGIPLATRDVRLFIIFLGSILGFYLETLMIIALLAYSHVILNGVRAYKFIINSTKYQEHEEIPPAPEGAEAVEYYYRIPAR